MKTVLAVGGDPGGAKALAPVLRELHAAPGVRLRLLAYRQAAALWAGLDLPVITLPDDTPLDPAHWTGDDDVALLLTSTSVNGIDHERAFVRWARESHVPSLAVLDFWSNYAARFRARAGAPLELPSLIAVMDERARDEMVREGFPAERLAITGQPAFDGIDAFRAKWTEAGRNAARQGMGVSAVERLVLFVSQPLVEMARLVGLEDSTVEERQVIRAVAESLGEIAKTDGMRIAMVVRPHPRQQLSIRDLPNEPSVRVFLSSAEEPWAAALAADVVVGMTTVLLTEACLLGCRVVSVRPGDPEGDPLPGTNRGDCQVICDLRELTGALRRSLAPRPESAPAEVVVPPPPATGEVLNLVRRLMTNNEVE